MNKRTIIHIGICFLGSILLVFILQLMATGPNQQKNHFIRLFPPHFLSIAKSLDLNSSKYYIAGQTKKSIYLVNSTNSTELLEIDWQSFSRNIFSMHIPDREIPFVPDLQVNVDSPFLYINNDITGSVWREELSKPTVLIKEVFTQHISNSDFLSCSENYFVIRTFDRTFKQNVLSKLSYKSENISKWPLKLEQQMDGVFSSDGVLRFDPITGQFIYVYYYCNQFLCLDSNLKLQYQAQTLDTNAHVKIRVSSIPRLDETLIASPSFRVNRVACISSDWIFINSELRADNEEKKFFDQNLVMDVYGLKDGHYHFSFYLPKDKGKIRDMAFKDNILVAIQDHSLVFYKLNIGVIKK